MAVHLLRRRGFNLAEVMVSLLLITIAVLGLVSVHIYSARAAQGNRGRHTASLLAASRLHALEEAVRQDFAVSVAAAKAPDPDQPDYQVEVLETLPEPTLKRVEVRVSWDSKEGPQRYDLWTLFYAVP